MKLTEPNVENQNVEWPQILWSMAQDIINHELGSVVASNKELDGMSKVSRHLFASFACVAISADKLIKDKKNKTSTIFDGENDLKISLRLLKDYFDDVSETKVIKKKSENKKEMN